jgi:ribosome-associated translation inhibitor RaiA
MTLSADITYRNVPASDWLDAEIQKHVARLLTYCADILSCKVLVEIPHRHHEHGNHFCVRIDMTVPGDKLVAGHEAARKDAATAFRQAFAAAKRQLQDYARRRRHEVKAHPRAPRVHAAA